MGLHSLGTDIWVAESTLNQKRGPRFPLRMTVLRLQNNELMVISPVRPTSELVQGIKALGTVKYIVAPNGMHHLFVLKFSEYFPSAEIWGPKDLHDKRHDIAFNGVLDEDHKAPWSAQVEQISVIARPPMFEEIIFFHKASKTVIVTDLLFNVHQFNNWIESLIAKLNGGYKKLVITRLGRRIFNHRDSLHRAAAHILAWNPENLVVAHGDVVQGKAALALREPLADFVGANS